MRAVRCLSQRKTCLIWLTSPIPRSPVSTPTSSIPSPNTMSHNHEHRDFRCPECGELVTCLSCLEIHAATLPRGPAFLNAGADTGTVNPHRQPEPRETIVIPPPAITPPSQQSLFA